MLLSSTFRVVPGGHNASLGRGHSVIEIHSVDYLSQVHFLKEEGIISMPETAFLLKLESLTSAELMKALFNKYCFVIA